MAGCLSQFFKQSKATNYFSLTASAFTCSTSSLPFSLFLIFFFLFFFFFLLVCTNPKHLYRPKQPDFAGTAGMRLVWLVFFPVRNKGYTCTGALIGTVYTGHTDRYGTKLTSLHYRPKIISLYGSVTHWHCDRLPIGSCFNYLRQKMWSTLYIVGLVGRELKLEEMLWR